MKTLTREINYQGFLNDFKIEFTFDKYLYDNIENLYFKKGVKVVIFNMFNEIDSNIYFSNGIPIWFKKVFLPKIEKEDLSNKCIIDFLIQNNFIQKN